jgi:hypothetical protein
MHWKQDLKKYVQKSCHQKEEKIRTANVFERVFLHITLSHFSTQLVACAGQCLKGYKGRSLLQGKQVDWKMGTRPGPFCVTEHRRVINLFCNNKENERKMSSNRPESIFQGVFYTQHNINEIRKKKTMMVLTRPRKSTAGHFVLWNLD